MDYAQEKEIFDKNINISYVNESLPQADNKIIIKHYICSLIVYGVCVLLIWVSPFFSDYISYYVKLFYNHLYLSYILIAPIIYFYYRPKSIWISHNIAICEYVKRVFFHLPKFASLNVSEIKDEMKHFIPTYVEQQSIMLVFIKCFFSMLMINSFWNNLEAMMERGATYKEIFEIIKNAVLNVDLTAFKDFLNGYKEIIYNNIILFLFSIDLVIFCAGYLTELPILKNKIRSVETTPAGIFFCLICYPPFIAITQAFIRLPQDDGIAAFDDINSPITWIFRIVAVMFLVIYASASVALGFKGSNLTNRGTVSCFPYNIVRHPAYISKNIFWMLTTIPALFVDFSAFDFNLKNYIIRVLLIFCAIVGCAGVYYMRALTEERHLIKDPDYQQYTQKVKYRFIPFVI